MAPSRTSIAILACAGAIATGERARSESLFVLGGEFQVNSYTANSQKHAAVDMDATGRFVVAWASYRDGSGYGVFARRFDAAGTGLAAEFQVSAYTADEQASPAVATDADGDFVVVWSSLGQDGSGSGVFARRFDAAGAGLGGEFQVNVHTIGTQRVPAVDMHAGGDFVVTWSVDGQDGAGEGVFARRFDAAGTTVAAEFQVNILTAGHQLSPAVGIDADGDFVIAWTSEGQDAYDTGVFARRFDATGAGLGAEFQVNDYTTGLQYSPAVGVDADGDFVVTWISNDQDGHDLGVFARRFDAAGSPQAIEFQVNAYTVAYQLYPAVGVNVGGDFVVAWSSFQDGDFDGVFARRFDSAGVDLGGEFQVNTHTLSAQRAPAVGAGADGGFVVAWTSGDQDGSDYGVFAQRFTTLADLDLDGDGSTGALTDGLLLLRHLFGFTGTTLTSGAVGGACLRCDAGSITAYLASLPATLTTLGGELQINAYTQLAQTYPAVGVDTVGDFVVAWGSASQDGESTGVFARAFDAASVGVGAELQVNAFTADTQGLPAVDTDSDGDFVVAWHSYGQDGSGFGIFARRFASSGTAIGSEFAVNTYTSSQQGRPTAGMDADGDFVVAWQSYGQDGDGMGVFARRFNAAGSPVGGEFRANTHIADAQAYPAVSMDADGDFVVAWASNGQDGANFGVFARRFDSAGAGLGVELQVNAVTAGTQRTPAVDMNGGGDFVVAWHSNGQDGSGYGVFARRFSAAGVGVGAELQVNTHITSQQGIPAVAIGAGGDFVVAWQSYLQDGSLMGVFARRFDSAGAGLDGEFQVNTRTTLAQAYPDVGLDGDGGFVVAWASNAQDGSGYGIFAQRFALIARLDVDGDGSLGPLTDGLLALRFLFGFTGATLTNGAVGGGCTRCNAPAIEAYLQTLI